MRHDASTDHASSGCGAQLQTCYASAHGAPVLGSLTVSAAAKLESTLRQPRPV